MEIPQPEPSTPGRQEALEVTHATRAIYRERKSFSICYQHMSATTSGTITSPKRIPPPDLLARLLELEARLSATDLRPSPEVDEAFGHLVELCTAVDDDRTGRVLGDPSAASLLASLRSLSARGESELEYAWARRVIAARDPWAELQRFPYLDNYHRLVRFELAGLTAVGASGPETAVILGAGPLPLTGLVLARHGIHVTDVDNDPDACELASALIRALGLGDRTEVVCGDARRPAELPAAAESDIVLLAALAGSDREGKRAIARTLSVAVHPGALLLARSAHRLRTALYPPLSPDDLAGFAPLVEMHPCDDVVNSVLIARPVRTGPAAG